MAEETDNERIRREHAALLKEKAEAEAIWHTEVRNTLKHHGEALNDIKLNVTEWKRHSAEVDDLSDRVKKLEDFKLQAVAYWTAASAVVIALWKVAEKFL